MKHYITHSIAVAILGFCADSYPMKAPVALSIENNSNKTAIIQYDWKKEFSGDFFALGHSLREETSKDVSGRIIVLKPEEKTTKAIEIFPEPHDYLNHLSIALPDVQKRYVVFTAWDPNKAFLKGPRPYILKITTQDVSGNAIQELPYLSGQEPYIRISINKDYTVSFQQDLRR